MNAYNNKIYYEDFRKKYAYEKSIDLFRKINKIIGVCDTKEKAHLQKNTAKIATEIALAIGSILSDERRDFHYKVSIRQTYELTKLINEMQFQDFVECVPILEGIIKLLRTYRKNLRLKENNNVKTVEVGDRLDIKMIKEKINNIKEFRDLKAYKIAINFYTELYGILSKLPLYEQYNVFDQMDRASMSIVANLAEGNGRKPYTKVEANFYSISFATSNECQAWLDIMKIKGYISSVEYAELNNMLEEIKKLIIAYIRKLMI